MITLILLKNCNNKAILIKFLIKQLCNYIKSQLK